MGKGVGRALLLYLYKLMTTEGLATAASTRMLEYRRIRLYERCGFTSVLRGREFSKSMGIEREGASGEAVG
ncbi:GNAT family N-acetyltransferase [Rhizobium hidalgonense]|nr:GNAT family N-acetyltransferase [Rhizobium hidalgonense]